MKQWYALFVFLNSYHCYESCVYGSALALVAAVRSDDQQCITDEYTDSKVHRANMGPTWVLSAPDEPHVSPINLAIGVDISNETYYFMYMGASPCAVI